MNKALTYLNNAETTPVALNVIDRLYGDEKFMDEYLKLRKELELKKIQVELKHLDYELKAIDA